jgi:hypothetical protein
MRSKAEITPLKILVEEATDGDDRPGSLMTDKANFLRGMMFALRYADGERTFADLIHRYVFVSAGDCYLAPIESIEVDLFAGEDFSPFQADLLYDLARIIAACCGRRVGKTVIGSRKMMEWMHDDLEEAAQQIAAGELEPWIGANLKTTVAKTTRPHVHYWIVAPRDEHLTEIRGYLLELYERNGVHFRHPKFPDWFTDKNRRLWVHHNGAVGRYDFIPATSMTGLAGKGLKAIWIDEAGFIGNDLYQTLRPTIWEHAGRLLATGTPSMGDDHWFTILAASGLDKDHERYDPDIAKRNPEVSTYIADTVHHAFIEQARREALKDIQYMGEIWAATMVWADWRMKALAIFGAWREGKHVVDYSRSSQLSAMQRIGKTPWCTLGRGREIYRPPSKVYGMVDWSGGTAPGAAVVALTWKNNPLDPDDPRTLVVVVEDYEGHDAYTSDGWWRILKSMDERWQVDKWIGDPHSPHLIKKANKARIPVKGGAEQDKMGRLALVHSLVHWADEKSDDYGNVTQPAVAPALYVSRRCETTAGEISGYRWAKTRDGKTTNKPRQNYDHCIDCLAMLAAEIEVGPGGIQIGRERWG